MVPLMVDEHLGLVLQAAEGAGVDDPVTVPLEDRPVAVLLLGVTPPPRSLGELSVLRQVRFHVDVGHAAKSNGAQVTVQPPPDRRIQYYLRGG